MSQFEDDFDDFLREFEDDILPYDTFVSIDDMEKRLQKKKEAIDRSKKMKNKNEPIKKPAIPVKNLDLSTDKSDLNLKNKPKTFFRTIEIKGRKIELSADKPISDKLVREIVDHYYETGVFGRPQTFVFDDDAEDGELPFQYPNPFQGPKMTHHPMFRTNEVQIEQVGEKLEVKIAYNVSFISAIKGLPKSQRYFDPKRKLWIVSVSQITALEALLKAAGADFRRFKPKSFDLYEVLNVSPVATQDEIKKAFYRAARSSHPDVCADFNAREKFEFLKTAYDVLRNPQQRKKYDFARNLKRGGVI